MRAVARYQLAEHLGSRRWVAASIFLAAGIVVLYAQPPNPVLSTAGTAAAWLLPAMAWWALAFLNTQGAEDRQTIIAAAGARSFIGGRLLALSTLLVGVALATLAFPVLSGRFERPAHVDEMALILLANLICGAAGCALAALLAEPSVRSRAAPVIAIVGCLVLSIPLDVSPAIGTAAALDRTDAARVPAELALTLTAVAAFVVAATLASAVLWRRRE